MTHKSKPKPVEIVRRYAGRGEILFPQGGRIRSRFELTEDARGQRRLTCAGEFTQASYRGWEQLVHQYRLGPTLSRTQAEQRGLTARYAGQTTDTQQLSVGQMVLITADAQGVDQEILRLEMQFDCADIRVGP